MKTSQEIQHDIIDLNERQAPMLRTVMEKELQNASTIIDRLTCELASVENAVKNISIFSDIERYFERLREYINAKEAELKEIATVHVDEFLAAGDGRVALESRRALAEQGEIKVACLISIEL